MLALWEYEWDDEEWSGVSMSSASGATDGFAGLLLALQWEGTTPSALTTLSDPFFGLLLALRWDGNTAPISEDRPTVGGHGKKKNDYLGQDEAFWLAKAEYLRQHVKPAIEKVLPPPGTRTPFPASPDYAPLQDTITPYLLHMQALQAALQRAINAQNMAEMQQAAQRTRALALDIQKLQQQDYERAIEILLLDVF